MQKSLHNESKKNRSGNVVTKIDLKKLILLKQTTVFTQLFTKNNAKKYCRM